MSHRAAVSVMEVIFPFEAKAASLKFTSFSQLMPSGPVRMVGGGRGGGEGGGEDSVTDGDGGSGGKGAFVGKGGKGGGGDFVSGGLGGGEVIRAPMVKLSSGAAKRTINR